MYPMITLYKVTMMEYMTAQDAAEKWDISDRRVRMLCSQGKIPGAYKDGKSYQIPADAEKPADGRERPSGSTNEMRYLKWENVGQQNRPAAPLSHCPTLSPQ